MSQVGPSNPYQSSDSNSDSDKAKDKLTYFFPKGDWRGEYGFDWFRLKSCPEQERLNSRAEMAAQNTENIGCYINQEVLKNYWMSITYDNEHPEGKIDTFMDAYLSNEYKALYTDVRSDKDANTYAGNDKLIDNDVDMAYFFSKENFATYIFYDGVRRVPVVHKDDKFWWYYYETTRHPLEKQVYFEFSPTGFEYNNKTDDKIYYKYTINYKKGVLDILKILRIYSKRKKGTYDEEEDRKIEYREYRTKSEVKKANERQKNEEKKRNKKKKKNKNKDNAEPEPVVNKWYYDMGLIDQIFNNDSMDKGSLEADRRKRNVTVDSDKKKLTVRYDDDKRYTFFYDAGNLVELQIVVTENSEPMQYTYRGKPDVILKKARTKGFKVEEKLVKDVYVDYQDDCLKNNVKGVEIDISPAYAVKMEMDVEKEQEQKVVCINNNEILGLSNVIKVKSAKGTFCCKKGGEFSQTIKTIYFNEEGREVTPYWLEKYVKGDYWLAKMDGKNIFYPNPHLALVNYERRDKRNGLKNDAVELLVKTFGDFNKIKFKSSNTDVFDTKIGSGSTTKSDDTIKLKAKATNESENGSVDEAYLKAYDNDTDATTGALFVDVYKPIHLKVCFVNVSFYDCEVDFDYEDTWNNETSEFRGRKIVKQKNANTNASRSWSPEDDKYIQILGQAGIIFDDIAHEEMSVPERYLAKDKFGRDEHDTTLMAGEWDMIINYDNSEKKFKDYGDHDFMSKWEKVSNYSTAVKENVVSRKAITESFIDATKEEEDLTPTRLFDARFLGTEGKTQYADYVRVYILDKYMINDNFDDNERNDYAIKLDRYQLSLEYDANNDTSFFMFKKSIEKTNAMTANPLAHAFLAFLGLENSFSNINNVTYEYKTTTNVMDFNDFRYTLNRYQWREMRKGARRLRELLKAEDKKWNHN